MKATNVGAGAKIPSALKLWAWPSPPVAAAQRSPPGPPNSILSREFRQPWGRE